MPREDESEVLEALDPAFLEESPEDLYENAPCGYLSTLLDGTIVRVNRTFLEWTGYAREAVAGQKRFAELLTVGGRIYYETHYAPLLQMQGNVRELAMDVVCSDGTLLPVLVSSAVKKDGAQRPALIRTTVFSARDRREYERELLRARERAEESESRARALAQTLQESLIPPAPPEIPGLDVAGMYRPAGRGDEVGGDFYDVFETPGGDWAIVVGDVAGKGVEAAGVTALARYTIRAAAIRAKKPRLVLEILNQALLQQNARRFCTAVYCRLHQGGERRFQTSLALGGHPLPLLMRKDEDVLQVGRPGTLLGVFEDPGLQDVTVELRAGDTMLFYTDGVIEGRRGSEFFGEERLRKSLASRRHDSAGDIASGLAGEVVDFQEDFPRDDIAIVAIKVPEKKPVELAV